MRLQLLIAFLLGVIATLLGVLVFGHGPAPLYAQSVDNHGGFAMGTANYFENGGKNQLWLVDTREKAAPHLCLYEARENGLTLKYARNIQYDFMMDQWPTREDAQSPSVTEAYNMTEKKRKEARQPPAGGPEKPPEKK